ncbi:hypothetical protein ACEPAF_2749 [Sanghuangporus sanghuang]
MTSGRSSLVVHHYAPVIENIRKNKPLSNEELLSRGRNLVSAVETRHRWRTVCSSSDPSFNLGERLVLSKTPPSCPSLRRNSRKFGLVDAPKQWLTSDVSDSREMPVVQMLKEFEGTDFSYLLDQGSLPKKTQSCINEEQNNKGKRKRDHNVADEANEEEEERKKKRQPVGNTTFLVYDLIPHPHHHPYSPVGADQRPNLDITKRFPPFSKAPFIPIVPFTPDKMERHLKDPYARSAWVIPVTGKLPWKESSPGRVVDNLAVSSIQTRRVPTASFSITWTPLVINRFWSDLLEIRKQATLGAISLSFHVASADEPKVIFTLTTNYEQMLTKMGIFQRPAQSYMPMRLLEQCTYVKLYHDVRFAMYVRSVLDAWRTEVQVPATSIASRVTTSPRQTRTPSNTTSTPPEKIKFRPLQGAKIILLDEAGQAIGIC